MWTDYDESMLVRCTERESGGWRCDAWLIEPDEEHKHFISRYTMYDAGVIDLRDELEHLHAADVPDAGFVEVTDGSR